MTKKEFLALYGFTKYYSDEYDFDNRSAINVACSNLSNVQEQIRFSPELAIETLNTVKRFLWDWDDVLKAEERAAQAC